MAEAAYELSIKHRISDKATVYLADAHCKLAKTYYSKKMPAKASSYIYKCIDLQNKIKRPVYHPAYKQSLKLKDLISRSFD